VTTSRRRQAVGLLLAVVLVLPLAACGAEDDPEPIPAEPFGQDPRGPQIGVHEALEREGESVIVNAFVVERDGETLVCDSLLQPDPPACGDPSMPVENLDVMSVEGATETDGVAWSGAKVPVRGTVEGGVLQATGVGADDG
jgi:hypothetical protein